MKKDNRIKYFAPADYSENSELDNLVKAIICRTAVNESLETIHSQAKKEVIELDVKNKDIMIEDKKNSLIFALEDSGNFANTHTIIKSMSEYDEWSREQMERLFEIAKSNNQVYWILSDKDLVEFYGKLLEKTENLSDVAKAVKEKIKENQ